LKPKEVLPTIAPLISRKRRKKMELGRKGGPAARGPKGGPALRWHVGGWVGFLLKGSPSFEATPKVGGANPKRGRVSPCLADLLTYTGPGLQGKG
jgi:hypothetical protein